MLSEKEVALLYETLMSAPGMGDRIKLDIRLPRKSVLLLAKVIEKGLQTKPGDTLEGLLLAAGEGSAEQLRELGAEVLAKSGLSNMATKLQILQLTGKEK